VRIKNEKDFWAGWMFLVAGIAFAWGAAENYNFGSSARPGPAYFPFGLGSLMAILGAFIILTSVTLQPDGDESIGPWPFRPAVTILGAVTAFGFAIPHIGMAIALPLLIGIGSLASGEFRVKEVIANSVVLTVSSWAIFIKGLGLIIPLWPDFLG